MRTSGTRVARAVGATAVVAAMFLAPGLGAAASDHRGSPRFTVGATGAGDAYFPHAGAGGYDVLHYGLELRYSPPPPAPAPLEGTLTGTATITLRATSDLDRFSLDLRGLDVRSLTVDGHRARELSGPPVPGKGGPAYWQEQDNAARVWELTVQPRPKLHRGQRAVVVVHYGGTTGRPTDIEDALYGWVTTRDGAMVANEPEAAMTWYPVSDHPTDKATYDIAVTVPQGKVAVANGLPVGRPVTRAGWTRWAWHAPDPMASYLSTASVGDYTLRTSTSPDGTPIIDAVDDGLTAANLARTNASLAKQGAMLEFFADTFTPYPFVAAGAIVDDDSIGYALETQTRPIYSRAASEGTVAHELAHQWFGDSVSPARWKDIWLNEGWATYCSWLWAEHSGGQSVQSAFEDVMAIPADDGFWQLDVTDPQPLGLFDDAVYDRGAAAIHALRHQVGDDAFFAATRVWLTRYTGRTATTEDFQRVYEKVSGQDLDAFFTTWLRQPARPSLP